MTTATRIAFIVNTVGPHLESTMKERFPGVVEFYRPDEIVAIADQLDAVMAIDRALPAGFLANATRLKWVHAQSHGFASLVDESLKKHPATVTNSRGVHAEPVAEHVFGMLLYLTRRLREYTQFQQEHRWARVEQDSLFGKTMCVVGVGTIGSAVAKRARAFGMRVHGVDLLPIVCDSLDSLSGPHDLDRVLASSDIVVIAVPYNETTRGMFDRKRLYTMKPGAYLINIARGGIVDEATLLEVLQSGRLSGAGFDVFETEPLPPTSPLWAAPNSIMLPHSASWTALSRSRLLELVGEQIRRFLAGEPLLNVVKPGAAG